MNKNQRIDRNAARKAISKQTRRDSKQLDPQRWRCECGNMKYIDDDECAWCIERQRVIQFQRWDKTEVRS